MVSECLDISDISGPEELRKISRETKELYSSRFEKNFKNIQAAFGDSK